MVKFSKELEAQLIPEWKEKYVNYKLLKKPIKKIKLLRRQSKHSPVDDVKFHSLYHKISAWFHTSADISKSLEMKTQSVEGDCECTGGDATEDVEYCHGYDEEEGAESELIHLFSEEDEVNKFTEMLEGELVKVDEFYQKKEKEMVEKGESLNKQLQLLLTLKRLFCDEDDRRNWRASLMSRCNSLSLRSSSLSSSGRDESGVGCDNVCMSEASVATEMTKRAEAEEAMEALERMGIRLNGPLKSKMKKGKAKTTTSSVRIDIDILGCGGATTNNNPASKTSTASSAVMWAEDEVVNSWRKGGGGEVIRKKVQLAEKMIRGAYVEFYKALGLLKSYSSLNLLAFTKIMKKFDKVANRQESVTYLKKVKGKQFVTSDKVVRQIDEVETLFIQHFADNDRKKAMKFLRPHQHPDSHMLSFLVGLFTGCFITLFALYAVLAHLSGLFSPAEIKAGYMDTVYPVFSMFALLSLHLFMYGCNLFLWKATRINYRFIFDFDSRTALRHKDAFLISTFFMTAVVASMVIHLLLKSSGFPPDKIDTLPSLLFLTFIALLICPFNIWYRPTRYCFLRVMRNIVFSPFCKVLMVDFFMADQLTSQIPLLRYIETTMCYLLASTFRTHDFETCQTGNLYMQLAYVVSFSPYYWRAMQCARRWIDESDVSHLANLGKYVSAMVAAGARLTYSQQRYSNSKMWLIIVVVTSVIATMYALYWDFKKDWGLLNGDSKNAWLRDNLVVKKRSVYYFSIGVNVILRVAWVESVLKLRVGLESRMLEFFMASLEVIRRGHWNFYRVENEHLNNVGNFRVEKNVPLPFRETDADD